MRLSWIVAYIAVLAACICLGYWSMTPSLLHWLIAPTPSGCVSAFILIVLLCSAAIWYARLRGATLRLPSMRRGFPGPFRDDPLQCLFVGTVMSLGIVVGSALGLGGSGSYGHWAFLMNLTVLVSLLFAQALNYFLHRRVIRKV